MDAIWKIQLSIWKWISILTKFCDAIGHNLLNEWVWKQLQTWSSLIERSKDVIVTVFILILRIYNIFCNDNTNKMPRDFLSQWEPPTMLTFSIGQQYSGTTDVPSSRSDTN